MTRDDLNVVRDCLEDRLEIADIAVHRSAIGNVNEGKAAIEQLVAEMDDFGFFEPHGGVAVGVSGGKMSEFDVIVVEVDLNPIESTTSANLSAWVVTAVLVRRLMMRPVVKANIVPAQRDCWFDMGVL
jgi:hypothetical protein